LKVGNVTLISIIQAPPIGQQRVLPGVSFWVTENTPTRPHKAVVQLTTSQ
jgi:hypothetical protein